MLHYVARSYDSEDEALLRDRGKFGECSPERSRTDPATSTRTALEHLANRRHALWVREIADGDFHPCPVVLRDTDDLANPAIACLHDEQFQEGRRVEEVVSHGGA
jgi:hypothetical protein